MDNASGAGHRKRDGRAQVILLLALGFLGAIILLAQGQQDPLDLDRDGWVDSVDSNPVSRAVIPWGDALHTSNDFVLYPWPDWLISAFKTEGEWESNVPAWFVPATASDDVGRLSVDLDRALLTNNLRFDLWLYNDTGSSLYAELYGTNDETLCSNLFGNLSAGATNGPAWRTESLPLATNRAAVGIRLRRGSGAVTVYESRLYIDEDGDGLDADQEKQLGTSDHLLDSDGDLFSDHEEALVYGTDPASASSVPYGWLAGHVTYSGWQTGTIHVVAAPAEVWTSTWSSAIANPGIYSVTGMPLRRTYHVRAYRDVNNNGVRDSWEAFGLGQPASLELNASAENVTIAMTDPDSDGDGMSDWAEMLLGMDPLVSNNYARLPFLECFETNTTQAGNLSGQNGWLVVPTNGAVVQTNTVCEGKQALQLIGGGTGVVAEARRCFVPPGAPMVWCDLYVKADTAAPANEQDGSSVAMYFNAQGYLVAWNGLLSGSNRWAALTNVPPVALGAWTRLTFCMDYSNQQWRVCVNGRLAAQGLGFASPVKEFSALTFHGKSGYGDRLSVSTIIPADLSLDGDLLPDAWELEWFGDLDETDAGDPDGDGLSNMEERHLGTNPANADTDGDGMPDGWEVAQGLNPSNSSDASADPDGDGLSNLEEYQHGTDMTVADTDGDGMKDGWEITHSFDPTNAADGVLDADNDGLTNAQECERGTDPRVADTDGDGMSDGWETAHGFDPKDAADGVLDADNDGLTNAQERERGTDPRLADTDGDGMPDGWEAAHGFDPTNAADGVLDADSDGLSNVEEYRLGTNPANADGDNDGLPDGWEVAHGLNPSSASDASADPDGDGLSNLEEYQHGTDMSVADTDGDGMSDGWEIAAGFDPLHADVGTVSDLGLALWLRADDLVGSNTVAVWQDRSGRGNALTQSVASLRPAVVTNAVHGQAVVDFDGANDTLAGRIGGMTGAVTVVTVCRFDSLSQAAADYDYVLNMGEDQSLKHLSVSRCAVGYASGWDNAYYSYMGGSVGSMRGPVLPGQYWLAIVAVHATNGTAHRVYVNGVEESAQQYTGVLTLDGSIDLGRFAKPGYANHYFNGQLAEVFVYDRALGTNECQSLYAYLQDRYSLEREGRPEVDAGADLQIVEGESVSLVGSISDDGQPNPPGQVTCQWTKTVGPGVVSFADATAPQTTAGFSASGAYVLRLTASDGILMDFDELQVTVLDPVCTNVPTDGLRLWLKADELPLNNGAPVAEWRDMRGQGHNLSQAGVAAQPVFRTNALAGRPAVDFDGANDSLAGQVGGITGSVSVVTVCRFEELNQAAGDYDYVLSIGQDQTRHHLSVSRCAAGYAPGWDNAYYSYMGGSLVSMRGPALPGRQWVTIAAVHSASGTAHTVYVDGIPAPVQQYTGTLALDGSIDLGRFVKPGYANHYLHGQIAETLVYDRALQPQDLFTIHAYLKARYGVPEVSDADGDGLSDAKELSLGTDPLVSNACAQLPFIERFEPDTCAAGDLHGQNGWEAWPARTALVQTNIVFEGAQALELRATNDEQTVVRHFFAAPASRTVWLDTRLQAAGAGVPTGNVDQAIGFLVDTQGRLVVLDGRQTGTNRWVTLANHPAIAMGRWIRVTAALDYASQTWLICLDGLKLAEGLGFGTPSDDFCEVRLSGKQSDADNMAVSATQPAGLSLDGDTLPDEWEAQYFGNFGQDDVGDPDSDGVNNLNEYNLGSDPTNADSDDDGLPDGWETTHDLSPTDASDASADPDGDGLSNLEEYRQGTDMIVADTDGDGLSDGVEVNIWNSNPLSSDSDGDGYADAYEVGHGTDPADPASYPWSSWQHSLRLSVRTNAVTGLLRDAPVLVRLDSNRVDYAQFAPGGADLRFIDLADELMDYEIEEWNPSGDSLVWVRIPTLGATNTPVSFFMKWGNPVATNAAYAAGVWQSYAGVWHLSDTDDAFADSAPGQYVATNAGAVAAEGRLGHARNFRGSDSIVIPAAAFASISNAVSIDFWQYGATNQPRIGSCLEGTSPTGREINVSVPWSDGKVYWDAFGNYDRLFKTATTNQYKGGWNHWTFTKDLAAGRMTIYLNGELWISATGKTRAYTPVTSFRLGSGADGTNGYMGRIDELRVENVAQPLAWIRFQHQSMIDRALVFGEQVVSVAAVSNAAEPATTGQFTFTRASGPTNVDVTVGFTVEASAATECVDYAVLPRSVTIPAGSLQITLDVSVIDDWWGEGDETVTVRLAYGDYLVQPGGDAASVTIIDDDQDADADGLCDGWELQHFGNLDATADADADADGVNNRDEYLNRTDPNAADSDQDGIPDRWELDHGLNPILAADAALDPDQDGLSNLEEYQAGTDRNVADTDGDGLSDGVEVHTWHTNPLAADSDGDGLSDPDEVLVFGTDPNQADSDGDGTNDLAIIASRTGVETSRRTGEWAEEGGLLYALTNRHARLEYTVTVPEDMYRLGIQVTNCYAQTTNAVTFTLQVLIDGMPVDWLHIALPAGTNAWAYLPTPWLTTGSHTLRFAWLDDYATNKVLGVGAVVLLGIDGARTNANGRQDWVNAHLAWNPERDTDGDGLGDLDELDLYGTDPLLPDTDGDTLGDGEEVFVFGTDPLAPDSDLDGMADARLLVSRTGIETSVREVRHRDSAWSEEGAALSAYETASTAYYDMTVTNAGMYRLALQLRNSVNDPRDNYRFAVDATLNGCLVGGFDIFADYDLSGRGYINTPWLLPGTYRVGIQWTNEAWGVGFRTTKRDNNIAIEKVELYGVDGADSDTNGVQDWMEQALQNGADTDADGIPDVDEINVWHTNPLLPDTDGDGLKDGEELGLGTDPTQADTDDDGISDGTELSQAFTDPLAADFDGTATAVCVRDGRDITGSLGSWAVEGASIYARDRHGYVEYAVTLPNNGTYGVEVEVTQHNPLRLPDTFDLSLYVDGVFAGRQKVAARYGHNSTTLFFLPQLPEGAHTLRVKWTNLEDGTFLQIVALRVLAMGGPDVDNNGRADWLDSRLARISELGDVPATSLVSPVCLEGQSRFQDLLSVWASHVPAGQTSQEIMVRHGVGEDWYADVMLSPTNATQIEVTDQNGEVSFATNTVWEALNVLDGLHMNDLAIRAGDALLLTAVPEGATNGVVTIEIMGVTNYVTTVGAPVPNSFDTGGYYTVIGTWSNADLCTNAIIHVKAVACAFAANPACLVGQARQWDCPDIPPEAVIEHDERLQVSSSNRMQGGLAFILKAAADEPLYMVARNGTNGPVLANAKVDSIIAASGDVWQEVQVFADGSTMVRVTLSLGTVPSDLVAQMHIVVGGVTFDDGTLTRTATASDFNALGEYTYYLIKAPNIFPSTCHSTTFYQGSSVIGQSQW